MLRFISTSNSRRRQNIGLVSGLFGGLIIISLLLLPENAALHSPGIINSGHEDLQCTDCHIQSEGSFRQKIQANIRYMFGIRKSRVAIGYQTVVNEQCLECHHRPNDRHPVYRFYEPRFKKARDTIGAHICNSCHSEHRGLRVSISLDFCQTCHEKMDLKKDPLSTSHKTLVNQKRWKTCLGCHDFHGNHLMQVNKSMHKIYPEAQVLQYFNGRKSPYSDKKRYRAKNRNDHGTNT